MFVCLSTMRERCFVFGGIGGMSDVNDLIDEKSKLKMSDGIVENQFKFLLKTFFFFFFFFFSFSFSNFVLHLHTHPFHTKPSISLS